LFEDASRLARSALVQELAILALKARDVSVLTSNGGDLTETGDEMKVAMRQIAEAFAQLERPDWSRSSERPVTGSGRSASRSSARRPWPNVNLKSSR
jgi:DNA invertase Pin-like site-specific DNA recombinase